MTHLQFQPDLPGTNELQLSVVDWIYIALGSEKLYVTRGLFY